MVEPAITQHGVQVFTCLPIADVIHPREVVETGGFDVQMLIPGHGHRDETGLVVVIGVDVESLRDGNIITVRKHGHGHGISPDELMAQAHDLDLTITMHRPRQADHGVGEVQVPGVGTKFLHIAGNGDHQRLVAGGVGESAGAAVFGVRLADPVLERDAPVFLPHLFTGTDLHRNNHEVGVGQGFAPLVGTADAHLRTPCAVHQFSQLGHGLQARLVDVY